MRAIRNCYGQKVRGLYLLYSETLHMKERKRSGVYRDDFGGRFIRTPRARVIQTYDRLDRNI
jgi:hypothetical protein